MIAYLNEVAFSDVIAGLIAAAIFATMALITKSMYGQYRWTMSALKSIDKDIDIGLSSKRKLDAIREKLYSTALRFGFNAIFMFIAFISSVIILLINKNYRLLANYHQFGDYFYANYAKYLVLLFGIISCANFIFSYWMTSKTLIAIHGLYDNYVRKLK